MRLSRTAAALLFALLFWGDARAQDKPAVEVSEGSVNVGLTPPPGCLPLPDEARAVVSKDGAKLKYGCVTPRQDALLFLTMVDSGSAGRGLADFERGFRDSQNQLHPDIKWLGRDVVKLSGGKWVRLRFREGPAADKLISTVYFTDWVGQFIVLAVSSPASEYERVRAALEKSAKSMQVSVSVYAPAEGDAPGVKGKP